MRVDVHAHLWSERYLELMAGLGVPTQAQRGLGAGSADEELAARFAQLDAAGVDLQVLSVPPVSPHVADEAAATRAARLVNDEYADVVAKHPERFRAFAALPLPHIDASLKELVHALDDLGMVGAAVTTSILGRGLGDPVFEPVYEELNRRGSVLYVHPAGEGAGAELIAGHNLTWSIGAPVEDTVAIMHLILAGIPSRYPDMKIIASHLGGALPMLLNRTDHQVPWEAPGTPELPSVAARRMWFDTVGHDHAPALRAAVETFGADRLVLGTDFPYQAKEEYQAAIDYVTRTVTPEQATAILDTNARELFGF
ncbi:amidohydrolase family protein [Kutzneria kofuensis]|uniref:Aminocarboxymuconate-semialdehyde decarboxylase n=1 Tax=Kutzneria kofuensis TaxID=103725 RepID=A0A7W9KF51_9PSEU|nr:amidohydrolase family protein [Kutzneria kofuensis]MBB5891267.1 aminocarboxymuconate-semialdehyde decarboxylase [Kutzneria kofuensis]